MGNLGAFGELLTFILYFILLIPVFILSINFVIRFKRKENISRILLWMLISSIPFTFFIYTQYNSQKESELNYVGIYNLIEYPNCNDCKLILNRNNTFTVTSNKKQFEKGKWRFRTGSDYWIVDIGEYGQLGSGKFKYSKKNEIQ